MARPILIMCHGQGMRFAGLPHLQGLPATKQFIPIADGPEAESIIGRTIRLAAKYGEISVWAPLHEPWISLPAQVWSVARPGNSLVGSLRASYPLWCRGATILLGDVVFSHRLLERMHLVQSIWPLVFGRHGENSWTGKRYGELYALVLPNVDAAGYLKENLPLEGKLWDVHNALARQSSQFFREVTDYTDDIDTQDDVEYVLPKLKQFVAEES